MTALGEAEKHRQLEQKKRRQVEREDFKKSLKNMSFEEKYNFFRHYRIEHPTYKKIIREIQDCHQLQLDKSVEPDCLFISGETGAGKTTLRKAYEQQEKYTRKITDEGTKIYIVSAGISACGTILGTAGKLLKALGDPAHEKGTRDKMTTRICKYIKDCEVELIILDELNHLIDRENRKLLKTIADWLKEIISETNTPVVALGLPTARQVLDPEVNAQLCRRFKKQVHLRNFSWFSPKGKDKDGEEFRMLLSIIEEKFPLEDTLDLLNERMAMRLFYATEGNMSHIMSLLKEALKMSLRQNQTQLQLETLAAAFEENLRGVFKDKKNPFITDNFSIEDLPNNSDESESSVSATNNRINRRLGRKKASDVL
ncbi:ATP-binding protein [Lyngbya sp. PCC 8106]|uniref:ATP-binding protein n=1 Tax=Lyngbya sp. (strain PCC 8106) TaxID=313612 RepID=UPI0000EA9F61|nr:ATP-binding protein [Lyngbya sp. PCC 8106]EAW36767.1 putative transposition protein [Lyngbya sp. PCC 8106]